MIYINDSGLYAVALKSTKPEALSFQRWVATDVLPSIRRTGPYVPQRPDDATSAQLAKTCTDALAAAVPEILEKLPQRIDERLAQLEARQRVNLMNSLAFNSALWRHGLA